MGARWAPFWRKKASFWRSDFLMRFDVREGSILGGVGGMADLPGKTRSLLKLAKPGESVRHASLPLRGAAYLKGSAMPPTPNSNGHNINILFFRSAFGPGRYIKIIGKGRARS